MQRAGLVRPLWGMATASSLLLVCLISLWKYPDAPDWVAPTSIVLLFVGLFFLQLFVIRLWKNLLEPLNWLEQSVGRVCQGEPGASFDPQDVGTLKGLAEDIGSLSDELNDLYEDMDNRVARQTRRLAQKTASLKILYEVAASVNHADDLTQLLIRYLRSLKDMVNGLAATVRLRESDGRYRLLASIDTEGELLLEHELLPVPLCVCGRALVPGDILCEQQDTRGCSLQNRCSMYGADQVELVEVPIEYHDQELGRYHIYVEKPGIAEREDVLELLDSIGNHLGMAVAKQRSDAEARRLSIIDERNHLAHELHDSLAQTLASLRFQVRMLQETLQAGDADAEAIADTQRVRNSLDEAHTELRELLDGFRAPIDQRGLVPALEKLCAHFRQETGLAIFFQLDCRQIQLSAGEEMQMLRVAQESLANIRKHAKAHTVRILLRCRAPGTYMLLIEDDGVGFERSPLGGKPGEHIGLSIMEERARRIGAELRIESEAGEGTRVELIFQPGQKLRDLTGTGAH